MYLDKEKKDLDYLYGRLIAVYEDLERKTYDVTEVREPNAIRLLPEMIRCPKTTSKILKNKVEPYFRKHTSESISLYNSIISEIIEAIEEVSSSGEQRSLKETYLFGYYAQRATLKKEIM